MEDGSRRQSNIIDMKRRRAERASRRPREDTLRRVLARAMERRRERLEKLP